MPELGQSTRQTRSTRSDGAVAPTQEQSSYATPQMPAITLPKGGGAIRGMGEKFSANPVTGSGSMSVPIATSPGRSGFSPKLSLSYDSGAGNGPFGFGWNLYLPSITRKTDKGLPQYLDQEESDVFILSGAEDLVPEFKKDATSNPVIENNRFVVLDEPRTVNNITYRIRHYHPRIEGLFARIERWTQANGEVHWRSFSKDNILSLYGKDNNSRIADPDDPTRIFSWLICETRDDKGNAVLYEYKAEDGAGVDLTQANERNRGSREDRERKTNRYLKRIKYGNRKTLLDSDTRRPVFLSNEQLHNANWMLEVVFDYGEHAADTPAPDDASEWSYRNDPFSSYRAGFEVRTTRLCQRVLMFHHFDGELGVGLNCLVHSTDFTYTYEQDPTSTRNPVYTFLLAVTQAGYKRNNGTYFKRSLPPVTFEYTLPVVQDLVQEVDRESVKNLPVGLDGTLYQWIDLHGEGIPGILTEQAGTWLYKRNISPISERPVEFAPLELVATRPNLGLTGGQSQFMDLAGDGRPDLVTLDGPLPGFYGHDEGESWQPFRPFTARLNRTMRDPNLKLVDLDGDGHADVLISEDEAFVWHASLAEAGFGPARRIVQMLDEEKGPRLVFADGTQSVYLADLTGDGLSDLVRVGNGEICYWPNLGYGRFGAKITMDQAPHFDNPDQFDQKRIRLADIDGTGTIDIIYLHRDGVRLYFNQSGNSWSVPHLLKVFPRVDDLVSIIPADLKGNGTACLVWSSPLLGDMQRQMRYVDLMGGEKPHLLVGVVNNLGAETRIKYAPSTKFYLQDKRDGQPWLTRLPFPVHVVERVETYDRVSRNRFVSHYAYHHGYFDGVEREFRGFGLVEQWDTEEINSVLDSEHSSTATNLEQVAFVPPIHTRTWFHTGVYLKGQEISRHLAAGYYGAPDDSNSGDFREFSTTLLDDTILPDALTLDEEREACRALKGMMLRQEIYGLDGTDKALHPYSVTEQNFTIERLQPKGDNRHAVFFTHAREAVSYHYERNPTDPRIGHTLVLEVDSYGNVLKSVAIGYGRKLSPLTEQADQDKQTLTRITCTENTVTNSIDDIAIHPDDYLSPLSNEALTYELTGYRPANAIGRFQLTDFVKPDLTDPLKHRQIFVVDNELKYEDAATANRQRRLIEHARTFYRKNDLTALLPSGVVESLALPGESYRLAFTPGLLDQLYVRGGEMLLPANPADVLAGNGADRGGYVDLDSNGHWWIPSGHVFYSPTASDNANTELAFAGQHFFLPHRYRNPFNQTVFVTYDSDTANEQKNNNLLIITTGDALQNTVKIQYDYRVLQPWQITDPNGNRSGAAFDTLGMVVGTAVMGKAAPAPIEGDSFAIFTPDLTPQQITDYFDTVDPRPLATLHLGTATTRIIYDLSRVPACAATIVRETHVSALVQGAQTQVQLSFSYSDGFGREIQKKIQAEPGPVPRRDAGGAIVVGANGQPQMTPNDINPRWVGSGWTIFNNKGKPVRQFEPFFSDTRRLDSDVRIGVSPVLFYDPAERVVAALHPNHTYEKVVFDPWQQTTYDVNDTVLNTDGMTDPKLDKDVQGFFARLPEADYLPTWYEQRKALASTDPERVAADKVAIHRQTPTVAHFDTLGRSFLTIAHNRFERNNAILEEKYSARVELDIEGNQRAIRDASVQNGDQQGRLVMRYGYDILGNRLYQTSMEAGERWTLNDVTGKPIRAWDSRRFMWRLTYDELRRPLELFVNENGTERLAERTVYGESQGNPANHRTRVYQIFDGAGVVTSEAYDFKGNLLRGKRELLPNYKQAVNWQLNPVANDGTFTSLTSYDALNRPVIIISPDGSVYRPTFNEANLLDRVDVNLRGSASATPFVTNIDYNARGQRVRIVYASGVSTSYEYDPFTFRLIRLKTTRPAAPDATASQLFQSAMLVQDLSYTYDPVGNITRLADAALKTIIFNQQQVEPVCAYTYDALYRLTQASGREHIGQTTHDFNPSNRRDFDFAGLTYFVAHPNDMQAMRNYTERYEYDMAGNFQFLRHDANGGSWKREYQYKEGSLLEPTKQSNRLTKTSIGNGASFSETYRYTDPQGNDVHGCMTAINNMAMTWDDKNQLQQVNLGGGGMAYYIYDAAGQRVRKVIETQNGARSEERLYLGEFEVYRKFGVNALTRETLHIMDDKQRVALLETQVAPVVAAPLIRYQIGNHLGSASLELDEGGGLISYEEYHPYGTPAFQTGRSAAEVSLKRYRYTGKERDDETGFSYHGARYYAPWLGRWTSCDPVGLKDGMNLFMYSSNNPIRFMDPHGQAGKESKESLEITLPLVKKLDERGIRYSREVPYTFTKDGVVTSGIADLVYEDPKTGLNLVEAKRAANSPQTTGQKVILPELAKGAKVKITGPGQSGNLALVAGREIDTSGGRFAYIHKQNFGKVVNEQLGHLPEGNKYYQFTTSAANGTTETRYFSTSEELTKFQAERGVAQAGKINTAAAPAKATPAAAPAPAAPVAKPVEPSAPVQTEPVKTAPASPAGPNQSAKEVPITLKSGRIIKIAGNVMDFVALAQAKDHDDVVKIIGGIVAWRIAYGVAVKPIEPAIIRIIGAAGVSLINIAGGLTTPFIRIGTEPKGA